MLTRTLLFLLAFMTGLSPFEAANAAQPERAVVNASASAAAGLTALTARVAVHSVTQYRVYDISVPRAATSVPFRLAGRDVPCISCVHRSDRSRE